MMPPLQTSSPISGNGDILATCAWIELVFPASFTWAMLGVSVLVFVGSENAPRAWRRMRHLWILCLRIIGLEAQSEEKLATRPKKVTKGQADALVGIVRLVVDLQDVAQTTSPSTLEDISNLKEAHRILLEGVNKLEQRFGKLEEAQCRIHGLPGRQDL